MSESERVTRKVRIDSYLRESGWEVATTNGLKSAGMASIEIPLSGLPHSSQCPTGNGYADYVLYGDDGKPLAVVEAKRTSVDLEAGKVQAEQYADALSRDYGYKPVVYVCNGYETEIDDGTYPWRRVFGFHTQDELRRLIERRSARITTRASSVPLRDYQRDAVASVIDYYASKRLRSLVVMATGTGKTRIAAGVADLLLKNSFVKRILFIADRKNLAGQAMNKTFKRFFPDEGFGLLVEGRREGLDKRVIFTTYNTMMNLINQREFSIGYFDLIIIDEAHRSIFKKWGAIFDYFDAFLLGMTATPKDEVGASTYQVFNLDSGKPNYAYEIMQGVKDGYLTYFKPLDRRTGILKEGLRYEDLSADEKEQYGAWLFIKELVSYDMQYRTPGEDVAAYPAEGFPINNEAFEQIAAEASAHEGEPNYGTASGIETDAGNITAAEVEACKELINSIDRSGAFLDDELFNATNEELEPFFRGEITAEECAANLQTRVESIINS